jgi:hypothetical protein
VCPKQHLCGFCGKRVRLWQRRTHAGEIVDTHAGEIIYTWEDRRPVYVHDHRYFDAYINDLSDEGQAGSRVSEPRR